MHSSKRNKLAGKHPSYRKRGMSEASILKKRKRDKEIAARPDQKLKRADSNRKRRIAKRNGQNIKGKDYDHAVGRFVLTRTNRGRRGEGGRRKVKTIQNSKSVILRSK